MTEGQKDVIEEPKGPEQPAVDASPENAPATLDPEVRPVGVREGMFGVTGTGDTSGYGGLVQPIVFPAPSERPFEGWHEEVAAALDTALAGSPVEHAVENVVIHRGEITFHVRREDLQAVAKLLRDDPKLRFELCSGVSGVHYPDDTGRELHAVYHLLSMTHNRRIRLEVTCPDSDPVSYTHLTLPTKRIV